MFLSVYAAEMRKTQSHGGWVRWRAAGLPLFELYKLTQVHIFKEFSAQWCVTLWPGVVLKSWQRRPKEEQNARGYLASSGLSNSSPLGFNLHEL